jgi:hypothetical protein
MRREMPKRLLLAIPLLAFAAIGCPRTPTAAPVAVDEDAGPSWLGDAGLVTRAPVQRPLRELCGIASNPGDLPLGDDPASAAMRKGYFDAAIDLGGIMIRRDFLFAQIEPVKGTFDFAAYDRLVNEAQARGVRLLGMMGYGAPWSNPASNGDDMFPPNPSDFADFARATAARYQGKVAAWEIWNEPNNGFRFWKPTLSGDPAAYGALLKEAHRGVREGDPAVPVVSGGTVFTPQLIEGAMDWLPKVYAAHPDLGASYEIAGVHTYAFYPPQRAPELGAGNDPPLQDKLRMHAWLLDKSGAGDKPMWITELGWPVYDAVDAAVQARFLVRATILAAQAGASGIFWYTLRDGPHPEAFPPEDAFGLLHNDAVIDAGQEASPKPVYGALKALLAVVGDRWPTTEDAPVRGLPADGRAVVFRGASGGAVVAVWTVTTPSAEVELTGAADLVDQAGHAKGALVGKLVVGPDVTYALLR